MSCSAAESLFSFPNPACPSDSFCAPFILFGLHSRHPALAFFRLPRLWFIGPSLRAFGVGSGWRDVARVASRRPCTRVLLHRCSSKSWMTNPPRPSSRTWARNRLRPSRVVSLPMLIGAPSSHYPRCSNTTTASQDEPVAHIYSRPPHHAICRRCTQGHRAHNARYLMRRKPALTWSRSNASGSKSPPSHLRIASWSSCAGSRSVSSRFW